MVVGWLMGVSACREVGGEARNQKILDDDVGKEGLTLCRTEERKRGCLVWLLVLALLPVLVRFGWLLVCCA